MENLTIEQQIRSEIYGHSRSSAVIANCSELSGHGATLWTTQRYSVYSKNGMPTEREEKNLPLTGS